MFLFLYNFTWTLIIISLLPLIFLTKNQRRSERLGLGLWLYAPLKGKKKIWIHALSVGEVISAIPLIKALKSKYPSVSIVLTVKTLQGIKVARKALKNEVETLIPMPVDFWWSISGLVHYLCPSVLILVETDIWPGLLFYLKKKGIKVFLINGRISPRTLKSYNRFRFFTLRVLNMIDLCLMQSDIDRNRLIKIGLPPEKIKNTGNIKFDRDWRPMETEERIHWLKMLNLRSKNMIWVAGSTHEGEDEIILDIYKRLKDYFPELVLIIAPRKTYAAEDIHVLSVDKGLHPLLRSRLSLERQVSYEVLILDTIGELERIYGLADISFVGGSLVPVGGHNLLEPAFFGCPVLFGVYTHNFVLMSEFLLETGGGWRVKDREELFAKMKILLSDKELSKRMGLKAKEYVLKNSGAMDRVIEHIGGYISKDA